jgi:hypothetical protein
VGDGGEEVRVFDMGVGAIGGMGGSAFMVLAGVTGLQLFELRYKMDHIARTANLYSEYT